MPRAKIQQQCPESISANKGDLLSQMLNVVEVLESTNEDKTEHICKLEAQVEAQSEYIDVLENENLMLASEVKNKDVNYSNTFTRICSVADKFGKAASHESKMKHLQDYRQSFIERKQKLDEKNEFRKYIRPVHHLIPRRAVQTCRAVSPGGGTTL